MKNNKIIKAVMCLSILLALLLASNETQYLRNIFIACAWVIFVITTTKQWLGKWPLLKNLARVIAIPLFYHFVMLVLIAVGDAIGAWIFSDHIGNMVHAAQRSAEEISAFGRTLLVAMKTREISQFRGKFTWSFLILGGVIASSLLFLALSILKATPKALAAPTKKRPETE